MVCEFCAGGQQSRMHVEAAVPRIDRAGGALGNLDADDMKSPRGLHELQTYPPDAPGASRAVPCRSRI